MELEPGPDRRGPADGRAAGAEGLEDNEPAAPDPAGDHLLAVDEALAALAAARPDAAELVKLRYFAGLTLAEAAVALGVSPATVDRRWRYARAWLARRLGPGPPG